ncbi:MAG TPA: HD domain-containing protein [Solirubrobacterales bacterium]|nr:HD domain-containing protein [Solirubrobacterales bacterium]
MRSQQQLDPGQVPLDAGISNGRRSVRELADGQEVSGPFCVRERELRQKRNGEDFLRLVLSDRTGTVEAVAWDGVEESFEVAAPGSVVQITGRFSISPKFGRKITIEAVRPAADGEFDPDEIAEGPQVPVERLEEDLRQLIATVQEPQLRRLLDRFFAADSPRWARFREAPAAKYYHQAYRHGLLDHTLSVAQGVGAAAALFPGLDRDIAVTGALLHDIGKTEAYNDDPLAIELTDAGRLLGEIPLGYYMVRREIERIEGFDPDLAQAILHIVLSHHGALENGSPVVPATREAALVHALDNIGGKLGSFDRIERELPDGEAWSRFDRGIDSAAYFRSRAA